RVIESVVGLVRVAMQGVSHLPGWMLRWYYTENRLRRLMDIDVRPRGGQLDFHLGELPNVEMNLRLCNFAPLSLTLKQVTIEIWGMAGQPLVLKWSERSKIEAQSFQDIYVRDMQA